MEGIRERAVSDKGREGERERDREVLGLDWSGYDRTVWCWAEFLSILTVKTQDETTKYEVAVFLE